MPYKDLIQRGHLSSIGGNIGVRGGGGGATKARIATIIIDALHSRFCTCRLLGEGTGSI